MPDLGIRMIRVSFLRGSGFGPDQKQHTSSLWHHSSITASGSRKRAPEGAEMIQDGKVFCDRCQQPIPIGIKPRIQLLVEFRKGSLDRHFCDMCMSEVQNPSATNGPDRTGPK
jgi:hypothetical protein